MSPVTLYKNEGYPDNQSFQEESVRRIDELAVIFDAMFPPTIIFLLLYRTTVSSLILSTHPQSWMCTKRMIRVPTYFDIFSAAYFYLKIVLSTLHFRLKKLRFCEVCKIGLMFFSCILIIVSEATTQFIKNFFLPIGID